MVEIVVYLYRVHTQFPHVCSACECTTEYDYGFLGGSVRRVVVEYDTENYNNKLIIKDVVLYSFFIYNIMEEI